MAPAAFANWDADVADTGCFISTATRASEARLRSELSFKLPKMSFGGFVIHLLMGSLICSGTLYVGEYLPVKQLVPPIAGGPRGFGFIIILSGEYIIPYMFNVYYCFSFFFFNV